MSILKHFIAFGRLELSKLQGVAEQQLTSMFIKIKMSSYIVECQKIESAQLEQQQLTSMFIKMASSCIEVSVTKLSFFNLSQLN